MKNKVIIYLVDSISTKQVDVFVLIFALSYSSLVIANNKLYVLESTSLVYSPVHKFNQKQPSDAAACSTRMILNGKWKRKSLIAKIMEQN